MNSELSVQLLRDAMMLALVVGGPLFFTLLVAGLVVGVLQAATQINDPAVGFLPRLLAAAAVLWYFGGWMAERFARHLADSIARMGSPF